MLTDHKPSSEIPVIPADQGTGIQPYAVITVRAVVLYDKDRFGAYTWFEPKKVVREPGTCITAFYLLCTWVSQSSGDQGASWMFESLRAQVAHYRAERPPKIRDLGKAPFVALTRAQGPKPQLGDH